MTMTTEQKKYAKEVANIIWSQISVGVKMSLGMRKPSITESGIKVQVGPGNKYKLLIDLDPSDTYNVKIIKIGNSPGFTITECYSLDGVYCDMLDDILLEAEKKSWGC